MFHANMIENVPSQTRKVVFTHVILYDEIPSARGIGYDCIDALNEIIDIIISQEPKSCTGTNADIDIAIVDVTTEISDYTEMNSLITDGLPLAFGSKNKSNKKSKKRKRKQEPNINVLESKQFVFKYKQQILENEANLSLKYGNGTLVEEKYWDQRFRLMTRFDEGIILDAESWYSITPESIANHITLKCIEAATFMNTDLGTALDLFCGCGGNSISLGQVFSHVVAVDFDSHKLENLKHNAAVYNININSGLKTCCIDVNHLLVKLSSPSTSNINTSTNNNNGSMKDSSSNNNEGNNDDDDDEINYHRTSSINYNNNSSPTTVTDTNLLSILYSNGLLDLHNNFDPSVLPITTNITNSTTPTTNNTSNITSNNNNINTIKHAIMMNSDTLDVIFLAPPWGGPSYINLQSFDLRTRLPSGDGFLLVEKALKICPNVVLMIPRNTSHKHLQKLSKHVKKSCIVEEVYLYYKHKMTVVYFGDAFTLQHTS